MDKGHMQMDINNQILAIERKIPRLAARAFKVHMRFQKLYVILLNKLTKAIALKRIDHEDTS